MPLTDFSLSVFPLPMGQNCFLKVNRKALDELKSNPSTSSCTALSLLLLLSIQSGFKQVILFLGSGSLHMLLLFAWNAVVLNDFFSLFLLCLNITSLENVILLHSYKNILSFTQCLTHPILIYYYMYVYSLLYSFRIPIRKAECICFIHL